MGKKKKRSKSNGENDSFKSDLQNICTQQEDKELTPDCSSQIIRINYQNEKSLNIRKSKMSVNDSSHNFFNNEQILIEENALLRQIIKDKEIILMQQELLMNEKEKTIKLLEEENERLQQHYELIVNNIVEKDTIMDALNKINEKIDSMKTCNQDETKYQPLYSQILHRNFDMSRNKIDSLIIKPKLNQSSSDTKRDITRNINAAELKIGINSVTTVNGGIEIKCRNREDSKKLEEEIQSKFTDRYTVEPKKYTNPQIKIIGLQLEYKMTEKDLEKLIIDQNSIISKDDIFIVHHIKYIESKKYFILFAEVNGKLLKKIFNINNGRLFISWQNLRVYENNDVTQCYKCFRYNHKTKNCRNNLVCCYCGSNHHKNDCKDNKQNLKCVNCDFSNLKYKTQHCIKHCANDKDKCSVYKIYLNKLHSQINYE